MQISINCAQRGAVNISHLLVGLSLGLIIGVTLMFFYGQHSTSGLSGEKENLEPVPLYWVAPMDANYRRDQPGLSPMGMDLVPVYETTNSNSMDAGVVRINPSVINNIGVRLGQTKMGRLNPTINAVGYIAYNEDKLIHVHPRIKGWVEKLYIKAAGEQVVKGQPLYQLYAPELVNAQEEYLLALSSKEKRLILGAESRLLALKFPEQAIKDIKMNRVVQQHVTFYATQSGVVENLNIREGFYVQPGTTLFSIGDLSQVWIEAQVFERQAGQISLDDFVVMSLDYLPERQWHGQVDYIYPTLNEKTRTMRVRLRFENQDLALKPNMFAQVEISVRQQEDVLLMAKEALIRTGQQDRVVLALGEGQFKSVEVSVGQQDLHHVEVLSGLEEGEEVVISAQFLIDSESSKTSDFNRISPNQHHDVLDMDDEHSMMSMDEPTVSSARVLGVINHYDDRLRVVNVSREAIEKWGRAAATLDFLIADTIDEKQLALGEQIDFTFEVNMGEFIITDIHSLSSKSETSKFENSETGSAETNKEHNL